MNFTEILTKSRNTDGNIRNKAEQDIDNLATNNFPALMMMCAEEISNESADKHNRQLCATIIKNMILYSDAHKGKWEVMNPELKNQVKKHVLSCLASGVKEVRKAAGMTLAGKFDINLRHLQT